ncbi:MAG: lipopolysaccharide heptosyltransferase family protein [Gammaproteobacteria bacterium]|nr:lipopolysaccharide heptosyltransferase family protein [Gammaproteobacteria bacterium]
MLKCMAYSIAKSRRRVDMKIVIARTDNIGDVVLTLPMAGILKQHYPDAEIVVLARRYVQAVVEAHPSVDGFIDWESLNIKSDSEIVETFKSLKADIILHVFPVKRIAKCAYQAKIPTRVGTTRRWYNWLYCNKRVSFSRKNSQLHEAQLNLKLLSALNINTEYGLPEIIEMGQLKPCPELPDRVKSLLTPDKFNLVIHPGSNGNSKEWPLASFQALLTELPKQKFNIIITGSEAENERLGKALNQTCPEAINTMGKLSLNELIALLGAADGLVVNSTGPLHIASALGIKTLGLFPSQPGKSPDRWGPLGKQAEFLTASICQACINNQTTGCTCMQSITVPQVKAILIKWQKGNNMLEVGKKTIYVVGLSTITSNDAAYMELGNLWGKFFSTTIKEQLSNIVDPGIFAVYSDYENGFKGKYRTTIGYAVSDPSHVPEGLSLVSIPAGKYKSFKAQSSAPQDIIATWQDIWAADASLNRNFVADFELYHDNEASVYIGHN